MSTPASGPRRAVYVTGNAGKFEEAQHVVRQLCSPAGKISLERVSVELPELQGSEIEIATAKTREAERQLMAASKLGGISYIITDDSGLGLSCLNNFPGVYIKAMLHSIGDVGIGRLVDRYTDKAATATCTLGVLVIGRENRVETFAGELKGSIIPQPRGNVKHGSLSWNTVFVPAGETRTFGEIPMEQHATMSHRRHAFASFLASVGCLRPELAVAQQPNLGGATANPALPRAPSSPSSSLAAPVPVEGQRVLLVSSSSSSGGGGGVSGVSSSGTCSSSSSSSSSSGGASSMTLKQKREALDAKEFCAAWQSNAQVADWNTRWFPAARAAGAGAKTGADAGSSSR